MPTVDYRMARRAVVRDVRRGFLSRADVCDAHPELVRAARFAGERIPDDCPICGEAELRMVLYSYGIGAKRENGRVRRRHDLPELTRRYGEFACYVVEVCTECAWNHLLRSHTIGFRDAG